MTPFLLFQWKVDIANKDKERRNINERMFTNYHTLTPRNISLYVFQKQASPFLGGIKTKPQPEAVSTLLEKPAYNQQYSVHAPSHEDPL